MKTEIDREALHYGRTSDAGGEDGILNRIGEAVDDVVTTITTTAGTEIRELKEIVRTAVRATDGLKIMMVEETIVIRNQKTSDAIAHRISTAY